MGIGSSIALIAVGAILRFAVDVETSGFSVETAGTILMVAGVLGLVVSVLLMTVWAGRRDEVVVARGRAARQARATAPAGDVPSTVADLEARQGPSSPGSPR